MRYVTLGAVALAAATAFAGAASAQTTACLITKTDTNPFFVKMREGATERANELGIELLTFAGAYDGDNEAQVSAIETCVAAGASGILITPSDTAGVVPSVLEAREAGLIVIALDTSLEPIDAADATFATDNYQAGVLIGQWAAATMGDDAANARIAFLNLSEGQPSVDVQRNQGFMEGFGIDVGDPSRWGDETDPRIAGQDITGGAEQGGLEAMERLLIVDPDINVVYTINEPAAAGAYEALVAAGKEEDVLIVSIDGGCPGVRDIEDGVIGATSQQYPLLMASLGIEAIAAFTETGAVPQPSEGLDFFNTGVALIAAEPVDGVESISVEDGLALCWG